jgi:hypothetical protein
MTGPHQEREGASEDTALLILRVWRDDGGLRARMTEVLALNGPEQQVSVTTTVEATCARVHRWLARFLAGTQTPVPWDGVRPPPAVPEGSPTDHGSTS